MSKAFIPLKVAKDIERERSWEGIHSPKDLALYLTQILFVDAEKVLALKEITFSQEEPTGDDRGKIWIKLTEPIGIGLPIAGDYSMIHQYPKNVPMLYSGVIPDYMRKLSGDELEDFGLQDPPKDGTNWVIFE